jgi:hypothetical protein
VKKVITTYLNLTSLIHKWEFGRANMNEPKVERRNQDKPFHNREETTRHELRTELVRLLEWGLLSSEEQKENPLAGGRRSPLIEDEDTFKETAAILAARHPFFNGRGLGFDVPGTGNWPNIIMIDGQRRVGLEALMAFFGVSETFATRMLEEEPSRGMVETLKNLKPWELES